MATATGDDDEAHSAFKRQRISAQGADSGSSPSSEAMYEDQAGDLAHTAAGKSDAEDSPVLQGYGGTALLNS